jgi:hypothetical protein
MSPPLRLHILSGNTFVIVFIAKDLQMGDRLVYANKFS